MENCEYIFLSPCDLQEAFGIEARQVDSAEIGFPLFEHCFFEPHPERVLQKYPDDDDDAHDRMTLTRCFILPVVGVGNRLTSV